MGRGHSKKGFRLTPALRLALFGLIAVSILIWQREYVLQGLGWAFPLPFLWLAALAGVARWRPTLFKDYWNSWLGSLLLTLGLFSLMAFFPGPSGPASPDGKPSWTTSAGGGLGNVLIGNTDFLGGVRLFLFVLAGMIFLLPQKVELWGGRLEKSLASLPWVVSLRRRLFPMPKGGKPSGKAAAPVPAPPKPPVQRIALTPGLWQLPSLDLLNEGGPVEANAEENQRRARLIEKALESYGIEAKVVETNSGPTFTQFGLEPGWARKFREVREKDKNGVERVYQEEVSRTRVKVDNIIALEKDLTMALAVPAIRLEAPIPGKALVGIEAPNPKLATVPLRRVMANSAFKKAKPKAPLLIALGEGIGGETVVADLDKMPHVLVGGATGSGKSVFVATAIASLIMTEGPEEVRFILVDPKRVELTLFNTIPHLVAPVATDAEKTLSLLNWLIGEMTHRYDLLSSTRQRDIEGYNRSPQAKEKLPYLVVLIDELADLMMAAGNEMEKALCRLAQLGRATGIHLIVATQRPSVDVVTGLIKANFPTRISFAMSSFVDSRSIIDSGGAEKLIGRGDMLYLPLDASKPKRLQGAYISEEEIEHLVKFWNDQVAEGRQAVPLIREREKEAPLEAEEETEADPLYKKAKELALHQRRLSPSLLQRRLRVGYPRAVYLLDLLEREGIVSPPEEGEFRQVISGGGG